MDSALKTQHTPTTLEQAVVNGLCVGPWVQPDNIVAHVSDFLAQKLTVFNLEIASGVDPLEAAERLQNAIIKRGGV